MTSKQAKVRVETRKGKVWIARAGSEVSTDFDDSDEDVAKDTEGKEVIK